MSLAPPGHDHALSPLAAPTPLSLPRLARRVARARNDVVAERRFTVTRQLYPNSASRRLKVCLEAYASGLAAHNLPIPPHLRDEIRLRSGL
jgi:hypothetical protein